MLTYAPAADANGADYATFTFKVPDDGGTANGGVDLDPSANTLTIDVTSVNDAPAAGRRQPTTRGRGRARSPLDVARQRQHRPGQRVRPDA